MPMVHRGDDEAKWLYVLHIRRSDTVFKCDTRPPAVMRYMSCPAARADEAANHTLLLFTDESDQGYIDGITKLLAALPRWGGGVLHGDKIVRNLLEPADQEDNYLVYAVASLLMSRADQLFSMERCSGTQSCGNIRDVRVDRLYHPRISSHWPGNLTQLF